MVADLKAHLGDLGDLLPRHEVLLVAHPAMRHEECGREAELPQQGSNEVPVGLDRVVEGEDDPRPGTGTAERRCRSADADCLQCVPARAVVSQSH